MASPASPGLLPPKTRKLERLAAGDEEGVFSLCPFPPSSSSSTAIALYGGDDGTVYLLPPDVDDKQRQQQPKAVRAFDDAVRSIAVSSDGKRVAVGFDDGSTRVFAYPRYSATATTSGVDGPQLHPFLATAASSDNDNDRDDGNDGKGDDQGGEEDEDDGFGDMMSQEVTAIKATTADPTGTKTATAADEVGEEYPGPRFEAPIRSLSFLPLRPSADGGSDDNTNPTTYYLAIATESSEGFCIVDATTESTIVDGRYLQSEAETNHDSGGVRALAIGNGTVATLGLDGRLCTWKTPITTTGDGTPDPSLDWDELHQDGHRAVPKADIGELNGSDVTDRATRPAFGPGGDWLAVPGRSDVQLRHVSEDFAKERFLCSSSNGEGNSNSNSSEEVGGGSGGGGIRGHSDVIVCLTFSPDGNYLVSSGLDGRLVVWKVAKDATPDDIPCGEFVCEIPRDSIAAAAAAATGTTESTSAVVTSMLWTKDGTLRVAASDGSVTIIDDVASFIRDCSSSATKKTGKATAEVASATSGAEEVEYGSENEASLDLETQPPEVTAAVGSSRSRLSKKSTAESDDDDVDFGGDAKAGGEGDDDRAGGKGGNRFVDDEADEEDDDHHDANLLKDQDAEGLPADEVAAASGVDNFDDEDIPTADAEFPLPDDDNDVGIQRYNGSRRITVDVPEAQPAFAPSSTPISASTNRILCWNHIGTLTIRDDGPNNTVDINFVDGAFRRPVTFTDNLNFIVGSLGEDGGIFASDVADDDFDDGDGMDDLVDGLNMSDATKNILKRSNRRKKKGGADDNPKGSSVYFHRFETFGPIKDKDWVLTLPDGEMVLGCACGEGWAAVATSRRFLRLYSSGGNQGPISWLEGDLVTMVGRGRFLAVFYHEGTPMPDGTQRIGYQLTDATSGSLVSTGSVSAISPGSTLTWAGFSNDYSLMVMDSDGMLSMLASQDGANPVSGGWEWSPVLDTVGLRKSNDDSFWPVTCTDGKLVCVPLKGGNEHPDAVRRPVTTALGFRLPLARGVLVKFSALEDLQLRADLSLKQKKFVNDSIAPDDEDLMAEYDAMCAQVDKVTLKLFFDILKAGKVERALDLVERLHLEKSFEIAIKASDRLNYLKLSDRIEAARDNRFPPEVFDEEEDDGVDRRYFAQRPINTNDYNDDRIDDESVQSSTAITPDASRRGGTKRGREDFHSDFDEDEEAEEETPEERPAPKRRVNPFAKKRLESPKKSKFSSPLMSPSSKPTLSRTSTFSAQSRAKTKGQKRIL